MLLFLLLASSASALDLVVALRPVTPYVVQSPDGRLSGLEFEIIQAALQARGYHLKPNVLPLARLVQTFRNGQVDAAAPILAAHGSGGILSDSYLSYHNVAMVLAGTGPRLKSVEDLRGLSVVAFQTATKVLGPGFASVVEGSRGYAEEAQQQTQIRLLFSGRVQVIIGDSRILRALGAEQDALNGTKTALTEYDLFPPTRYSVAFWNPKFAQDFNAGLAAIRANGQYNRLLSKYR